MLTQKAFYQILKLIYGCMALFLIMAMDTLNGVKIMPNVRCISLHILACVTTLSVDNVVVSTSWKI